jgi:hypothetical protein
MSVSAGAWADVNKYKLLSTSPYEVVAPILSSDPATGDRVAGQIFYNLAGGTFDAIDASGAVVTFGSAYSSQNPQVTTISSAGSSSYNVPTGAKYLRVRMIGGGGGGGGSGTVTMASQAGTATTFDIGGGTVYSAGGGNGGAGSNSSGGAGGVPSANCDVGVSGGTGYAGSSGTASPNGGAGGNGFFGGGAQTVGSGGTNGAAAVAHSGGGGSGATATSGQGSGGGAGGYCEKIVANPVGPYSYTVGSAGSGGLGTNNGGSGAIGYLIVEAYFQ